MLRQYTHVLAGELLLRYNFHSFFVANEFVSNRIELKIEQNELKQIEFN